MRLRGSRIRPLTAPLAFAIVFLGFGVAPAQAQVQVPLPPLGFPAAPEGFEIDAQKAWQVANDDPNVVKLTAERGRLSTAMESKPPDTWQVGFFDGDEEVVQVLVDSHTGEVRESWTGIQVAWMMARGYEEQFGHAVNAPYVWIPLALVFFLGLLDWRRPLRIVHLDLLVLLSFGISHVFFNTGDIEVSVPLAYPPLLYLLARMLWIGFRGRGESGLQPSAPRWFLVVACLFLIAFRITLNVTDSGVIDVGYAGVIGAEKITSGEPIYGENSFPDNNPTGDTYGPANYYAYVPFETALPWSGDWDDLPSAHAAAVFFDLATVFGLFVLGLRVGGSGGGGGPGRGAGASAPGESLGAAGGSSAAAGPERGRGLSLGLILAFAWLAYPYTAFALQSNSNDALVSALLVWGLVVLSSPVGRGVLVGLAAMVKFAPLAVVPLYVVGQRGLAGRLDGWRPRWGPVRSVVLAGAAALIAAVVMLAHPAIDPGLAAFYERTVESQLERESPFSVWGQVDGLGAVQKVVLAAGGVLAVAVALWPRERSVAQVAALGAAVLIASQLAVDHWFYLYLPWFCGLVFTALALTSQSRHTA